MEPFLERGAEGAVKLERGWGEGAVVLSLLHWGFGGGRPRVLDAGVLLLLLANHLSSVVHSLLLLLLLLLMLLLQAM